MIVNTIRAYDINVKKALAHVVQNRAGYRSELNKYGENIIKELETVNMIHQGVTMNAQTYGVTKSGDRYYRDMYGLLNYAFTRLKGFIKRI